MSDPVFVLRYLDESGFAWMEATSFTDEDAARVCRLLRDRAKSEAHEVEIDEDGKGERPTRKRGEEVAAELERVADDKDPRTDTGGIRR